MPIISVVIRTLNEETHLFELLTAIAKQNSDGFHIETVIVDSGSTDRTLEIAKVFGCRVTHINKCDFSFGRSLNVGCQFAQGIYLVFISGHCIPTNDNWLKNMIKPLLEGDVSYVYGRQIGRGATKFSERQLFSKYFPDASSVPQLGYFCNNANAAILRDVWQENPFNESLTGCEDMYLAKGLNIKGMLVGYVAEAVVYHIHDESWSNVKNRYEREAIALQRIMPEVHVSLGDAIYFFIIGILKDWKAAFKQRVLIRECNSILLFRFYQYYGAYLGSHNHRQLSKEMKMKYFYPRNTNMSISSSSGESKNEKK